VIEVFYRAFCLPSKQDYNWAAEESDVVA